MKYDYKLNLSFFIEKIIKTYKSIQGAINSSIENILTNRIREIIAIIKSVIKCLKLTTETSKHKVNELILSFTQNLLSSNLYQSLWSNYKICFNEKTIEKLKTKPEEKEFILYLFKLINHIDDYYFYLLSETIPIFEIKDLLEENINEMEPDHRRILSITYSRFYVISPFNILSYIDNDNIDLMIEFPDNNLNGKNFVQKEEEENQNEPEQKPPASNGIAGFLRKGTIENITVKPVYKTSGGATSFMKVLKLGEKNLGLDPIYSNLCTYKRQMKLYMKTYFKSRPKMFIKFFEDVILFPAAFSIYKILYFSPSLIAKSRYLAYKSIYVFLECLNFFIETILNDPEKFNFDEGFRKLVENFFINDKPNQDITDVLRSMKDKLSIDVSRMRSDPKFEPLQTQTLLDYYFKYIKIIRPLNFLNKDKFKLKNVHKKTQSDNPSENPSNQNESLLKRKETTKEMELKEFKRKLSEFLEYYTEHKTDLGENVLVHFFETPTPDEDDRTEDLKRTIIVDLLFRIDFSKKDGDVYATNKSSLYNLMDCINKVFIADPDLWHTVIADISFCTKIILEDIIKYQLTYLMQFIYIDFHKLDRNMSNQNKDPDAMVFFMSLLEFLRLHCENHHKTFQTILFNSNITRVNNLGEYNRLDLVNFILKIPVLAKQNVRYYKGKAELISMFKGSNFNYFNTLITGVTDFLIEIIQGSFPTNMEKFNLGKYTAEQIANEKKKKNISYDNIDYPNIDFDNYIKTGYLCFDELDTEESEFFLAHFFRFVTCFFEESLNPAENKEKIVKKLNPKKLLFGLAHSTANLYLH